MEPTAQTRSIPISRSFARTIVDLARDVRDLASDHLQLAVLEAQKASMGLARLLCAAVAVSVLVITAWLALVTGGIVWATAHGVGWVPAICLGALLNLALATGIFLWARAHKGEVLFSATMRQIHQTADIAGQREP